MKNKIDFRKHLSAREKDFFLRSHPLIASNSFR